MSAISTLYKRWRHTRGFGVHSPFGYEIVSNVVAPRRVYGWYGYDDIDDAISGLSGLSWQRRRCEARLALRLVAQLKFERVVIFSNMHMGILKGVAKADSHMAIDIVESLPGGASNTLCICDDTIEMDGVESWMKRGNHLLLFGRRKGKAALAERLMSSMTTGLVLEGRRRLIAISHSDMQFCKYTIL